MLHFSGIGTYLQELLPRLCSGSKDSWAAACYPEDASKLAQWGIHPIPWQQPIYSPKAAVLARTALPSCNTYWSPHFNLPLLLPRHQKAVVTIHDLFHLDQGFRIPFHQRLYARLLLANAARQASTVMTVSEFSASRIRHYFPDCSDKIRVAHNGIPSWLAFPQTQAPDPLVTNKPFVLIVGNVKPHKNISNAIKAFSLLLQHKPEFDLVVVGKREGMLNSDINFELSEDLRTKIHFTGFISQSTLIEYYRKSSLFLFPSLYEGFGLPVLEAAALGARVCCSDIAPCREIAQGRVLYFDPTSPESMAGCMAQTLSTPHLANEELSSWLSAFSWENAASIHREVIHVKQ